MMNVKSRAMYDNIQWPGDSLEQGHLNDNFVRTPIQYKRVFLIIFPILKHP